MKKFVFYLLMCIYLLLVFADFGLTYYNTPDLSMEGNPLVTKLGLGWDALIVANVVTLALIFMVSYYSYFKYKTKYTNETKFTAYCSQIIYDRPDLFWKGIIPKHITPYIAAFGFVGLYALIFARAILVCEWLYITFNENWWTNNYFILTDKYCFGRPDIVVCVIITLIGVLYFFYKEFKKQLKKAE